jgi:hypothetical protein
MRMLSDSELDAVAAGTAKKWCPPVRNNCPPGGSKPLISVSTPTIVKGDNYGIVVGGIANENSGSVTNNFYVPEA